MDSTEGVKEIRDLIGAATLNKAKNCAFVTTADHFSNDAIKSRNRCIDIGAVDTFELYNKKRFLEMLDLTTIPERKKWEQIVYENEVKLPFEIMNNKRD